MCWRDDVVQWRTCSFCGKKYRGGLGHGCLKIKDPKSNSEEEKEIILPKDFLKDFKEGK